jgi:hypothetical protein
MMIRNAARVLLQNHLRRGDCSDGSRPGLNQSVEALRTETHDTFSPWAIDGATFPNYTVGRLLHYMFRGLLSVHSRCGLHARQVT